MRHLISILSSTACAASVALVSFNAAAHIKLTDPPARYVLPANKSCPCGDGDSNRTCQQTAAESSDPNRSSNVTTFEAGATITVRADEYVDHAGRMRVAFDPDGADLADFNAHVLVDEPDFAETRRLSEADPHKWEFQVTLPTEPCENCTLQVIQVMEGGTANPVADPAPIPTYYTCADIRIVAAGSLATSNGATDAPVGEGGSAAVSEGGAGGAGDEAPAGSDPGDDSSAGGAAATPGSAGPAAAGPAGAVTPGAAATGTPSAAASAPAPAAARPSTAAPSTAPAPVVTADEESDDGGCALTPGHSLGVSTWALVALGAVFTAFGLRRRQS